jgi:ferritin-like metal-binding protein YciE
MRTAAVLTGVEPLLIRHYSGGLQMKLNSLQDLFLDQLKDIYSAEKQITQSMPKMAKAAQHPEVRQAFEKHAEESKQQLERLNQVFEKMGATPGRKKCLGMEGLIKEAEEFMAENPGPAVIDAGLIANAQRFEHYEIAAYGTVRTFAETLGNREVLSMLQQTLDEERRADQLLTKIAVGGVNKEAQERKATQSVRSK